VIVWLNGTFGAGKTATAAALVPLIPQARLFDPETVGYMLQPNLADHPVSGFQHWAPWRPWSWRPPPNWPGIPASI